MGNLHGLGGTQDGRLRIAALLASIELSALFLILYPLTNWITTRRGDVPVWAFQWERSLPFVPVMLLPYASIDLFFVAAPFLCRSHAEISGHTRRVAFSIVTAAAFFLIMPLRLAEERPQGEGFLGEAFRGFQGLDQPHNLFPSLHVTLLLLVGFVFLRRRRGVMRAMLLCWFVLIGASTLLTRQHQVVDLAGGAILAAFAFYLFPDEPRRIAVTPDGPIARRYAIGAAVVVVLSILLWPWGAFGLWPAGALVMTALAYWGRSGDCFRKREGRIPASSRVVMLPLLLGQRLSLWYYRRQCRAWDEVAPGVFIGRVLSRREAGVVREQGVRAVLDLTGEFTETPPLRHLAYLNIAILDLTAPTATQVEEAIAFIESQRGRGGVYVHCKVGYSRSAAIVGAWLMRAGVEGDADSAMARLRRARPSIVIRPEVEKLLREVAASAIRE